MPVLDQTLPPGQCRLAVVGLNTQVGRDEVRNRLLPDRIARVIHDHRARLGRERCVVRREQDQPVVHARHRRENRDIRQPQVRPTDKLRCGRGRLNRLRAAAWRRRVRCSPGRSAKHERARSRTAPDQRLPTSHTARSKPVGHRRHTTPAVSKPSSGRRRRRRKALDARDFWWPVSAAALTARSRLGRSEEQRAARSASTTAEDFIAAR